MYLWEDCIMASETFVFSELPKNVDELRSLPEASMDSEFKTAALAIVALLRYEQDSEAAIAMIDYLRGPDPLSNYGKSFLKDRLSGKYYKVRSFFAGATVENNYTPAEPYSITVKDNPYSYQEENIATLYLKSSGADSERPIKLRKKPSTGQWFLTGDIACLADIRVPAALDPWA